MMQVGDLVKYDDNQRSPHITGIVVAESYLLKEYCPALYTVSWCMRNGEIYTCQEWQDDLTIISEGVINASR